MPPDDPSEVTRLLAELGDGGGAEASNRLLPVLYDELRALAVAAMRGEPADLTLQPTALVHEAYLKLVDQDRASWNDRQHFLAVAAQAMRRILVDVARARRAAKRGEGWERVTLSTANAAAPGRDVDLIALDDTLARLAELHPRQSRIVELRFFAGMTVEEVAAVLGTSRSTVEADWRVARAWLASQLGPASTH